MFVWGVWWLVRWKPLMVMKDHQQRKQKQQVKKMKKKDQSEQGWVRQRLERQDRIQSRRESQQEGLFLGHDGSLHV